MNAEQVCPRCGNTVIAGNVAENDPTHVTITCTQCHHILTAPCSNKVALCEIEEKTIRLCLEMGKMYGIKYYMAEVNKLPGNVISLHQSKQTVDNLLNTRGLASAVKRPHKNGCVIALFLFLLIIAIIIYFFSSK